MAKNQHKKILFVITKANWGGAQKYVFDLANNLKNFEVIAACGEPFGELSVKLKNAGIRTIKIKNLQRDINLWKELKLQETVKEIYPEDYQAINGLVNYVISESKPYYLYSPWIEYNFTESPKQNLSSQRISELLSRLGDRNNTQEDFFKLWIKQQKAIGGLYFDITSISTYSKKLEMD